MVPGWYCGVAAWAVAHDGNPTVHLVNLAVTTARACMIVLAVADAHVPAEATPPVPIPFESVLHGDVGGAADPDAFVAIYRSVADLNFSGFLKRAPAAVDFEVQVELGVCGPRCPSTGCGITV